MNEALELLKGYKTYIFLGLYIVVVLWSGQVPIEGTGSIFDLDPKAIQESLLAAVGIAVKAWANRTFGSKDGLAVEVK
jgi:hypothetical protein